MRKEHLELILEWQGYKTWGLPQRRDPGPSVRGESFGQGYSEGLPDAVHGALAKGLEWSYVFIVYVLREDAAIYTGVSASEMEEERRLFYVAATGPRTADHDVSHSMVDRFTQAYLSRPSRFVDELSDQVVFREEAQIDTVIRPV
jgi:hypothetical protein